MSDILDADPHKLSYLMVGRFLQHYSLLEAEINGCIQAGLNLDSQQAAIVTANIQMRDKISMIKSLVAESMMDAAEIKTTLETINQCERFSQLRNMMAHNFFWASDAKDAVLFSQIKARGKVQFPIATWTVEEFEKRDSENWAFVRFFEKLKGQLKKTDLARVFQRFLSQTGAGPSSHLQGNPNTPLPLAQESMRSPEKK